MSHSEQIVAISAAGTWQKNRVLQKAVGNRDKRFPDRVGWIELLDFSQR
jgi:hypothetical protein